MANLAGATNFLTTFLPFFLDNHSPTAAGDLSRAGRIFSGNFFALTFLHASDRIVFHTADDDNDNLVIDVVGTELVMYLQEWTTTYNS